MMVSADGYGRASTRTGGPSLRRAKAQSVAIATTGLPPRHGVSSRMNTGLSLSPFSQATSSWMAGCDTSCRPRVRSCVPPQCMSCAMSPPITKPCTARHGRRAGEDFVRKGDCNKGGYSKGGCIRWLVAATNVAAKVAAAAARRWLLRAHVSPAPALWPTDSDTAPPIDA